MAPFVTPVIIAYYVIAINFVACAAFGIDKMLAEAHRRRISEARLLSFALLGGSAGAYAGRHLLHKTRKRSFSNQLHAIAALQAVALAAFVFTRFVG